MSGDRLLNPEVLECIRKRWAAASKGPWRWFGYLKSYNVGLHGPGMTSVMEVQRWGMSGAQPSFSVGGVLTPLAELAAPDTTPGRGRVTAVVHPDAEAIAHSWEDVHALLAHAEALAELETTVSSVQEALLVAGIRPNVPAGKGVEEVAFLACQRAERIEDLEQRLAETMKERDAAREEGRREMLAELVRYLPREEQEAGEEGVRGALLTYEQLVRAIQGVPDFAPADSPAEIVVHLEAKIEKLKAERDAVDTNIMALLERIPGAIRVREGGGPEDVLKSLAVSVGMLTTQVEAMRCEAASAEAKAEAEREEGRWHGLRLAAAKVEAEARTIGAIGLLRAATDGYIQGILALADQPAQAPSSEVDVTAPQPPPTRTGHCTCAGEGTCPWCCEVVGDT